MAVDTGGTDRWVSRRWVLGAALAGSAGLAAGCGAPSDSPTASAPVPFTGGSPSAAAVTPAPTLRPTPHRVRPRVNPLLDAGPLPPNELGQVPVLMFHRVTDPVLGEYDITPDALWHMLIQLHAEGYRPVRTMDLVRRQLYVPRGRTPVVLTFDDSSPGQFFRRPDGRIDPRSGVGVLQAFARKHPAFHATATLYLNGHPFDVGDTSAVLQGLDRKGFELGNHTLDHVNLGTVSSADGQREIVGLQDLLAGAVPGRRPVTFSLPFGVWPADRSVPVTGSSQGRAYHHEGVLLVGSDPAPSPFSTAWDPGAVPRIRASSWEGGQQPWCANWWLDRLSRDPQTRYVSAGRPNSVTFPAQLARTLDPRFQRHARPYTP